MRGTCILQRGRSSGSSFRITVTCRRNAGLQGVRRRHVVRWALQACSRVVHVPRWLFVYCKDKRTVLLCSFLAKEHRMFYAGRGLCELSLRLLRSAVRRVLYVQDHMRGSLYYCPCTSASVVCTMMYNTVAVAQLSGLQS